MKAPAFAYHDPKSLADLNALLGSLENIRVLAGGQSLMPMLNMRYALPDHVIDINGITELSGIRETADGLLIGAMTRQRAIQRSPLVAKLAPVLVEALGHTGHVQTRSRGTIGGSLCHLDPSAEQPCIAALYDAVLHVTGPNGPRDIPMAEWVLMYMTPALEPNEALTGLTLPVWRGPHGHGFAEFARRHGDYAIVASAALLAVENGIITRAAIALAGIDVKPVRLTAAETWLVGQPATAESIASAASLARDLECMDDAQVSGDYRRRLAVTMTKRALSDALTRATGGQVVPR
jgi:carbon-monoxide dehydrogenase medium subunit